MTYGLVAIALLSGVLICFVIMSLVNAAKAREARINHLEEKVDELLTNGKTRQDHYTSAGLLDSQANNNAIEREIIDIEARLEYLKQKIRRQREINGVLLNDPRNYPIE